MFSTKIKYYIVVEGKSECQYFNRLNQLDEFKMSPLLFDVVPAGTHKARTVKSVFAEMCNAHQQRKNSLSWQDEKIILLDHDVFCRGTVRVSDYKKYQDKLYFLVFNFEDLLIQHLSSDKVVAWNNICLRYGHYNSPFPQPQYLNHVQTILPDYKKGALPFDLDMGHLRQLKENVHKKLLNYTDVSRDFAPWFVQLLASHGLV